MLKISEDMLQAQCVEWFKLQYPDKVIIAIPNGGFRNKIEAAKLKRCGVLPGVPDLFIAEPRSYVAGYAPMFPGDANLSPINMMRYPGFYIEMKIKGNKLTATLLGWLGSILGDSRYLNFKQIFDNIIRYWIPTLLPVS